LRTRQPQAPQGEVAKAPEWERALPEQALPEQALPERALPERALPERALPGWVAAAAAVAAALAPKDRVFRKLPREAEAMRARRDS
jgi:hypothetical protein